MLNESVNAIIGFVILIGLVCGAFAALRGIYRLVFRRTRRLDAPTREASAEPKQSWLQGTQDWGEEQQRTQRAKREKDEARRGPELDSLSVEYVGGHPDLAHQESMSVHVHENVLLLRRPLSPDVEIPIAGISSAELKTEEQISKDVTLTRMLLVGVWAFALKKKRVEHNEYIVIRFTDDVGLEHTLVLRARREGGRIYAAITKARRAHLPLAVEK